MRILQNTLTIIILLFFGTLQLTAQSEESNADEVVVILKSGTMFEGSLSDWTYGEPVTITTSQGNNYTFPADEVEKIIQKSLFNQSSKVNVPYNFKEKGRYYAVRAQFINGNIGDRANDENGYGGSVLVGYRYSRLLGVGIGIGYDQMMHDRGERVAPIFLEASGYATPTHTSLYYNIALGYGLAFTDQDFGITEARGGVMAYPAIGVRFGKSQTKYTLDLGYKFQKAAFTYANEWDRGRSEQRLVYKRLTLRFGVLF